MKTRRGFKIQAGTVVFLILTFGKSACADKAEPPNLSAEHLLRRAKMSMDTESLLTYLEVISAGEEGNRIVKRLIQDLGSADFKRREQAAGRLVNLGRLALPTLREEQNHTDAEIARQVKRCIAELDRLPPLNLPLLIVQLLVQRRVEQAAPSLIECLGVTTDPDLEEEIYYGLDALVGRHERGRALLAKHMSDAPAAQRAVAACILGHRGNEEQRAAVRKLLRDVSPWVRLRSAQGLLAGKESVGIPALIDLLKEPSVELSWQAEELLHYAAGATAPQETVGAGSPEAREKCRSAWERWWASQRGRLEDVGARQKYHRPCLILACAETTKQRHMGGRLWLSGCDGNSRWAVTTARRIGDARLIPGNKVLLTEFERGPDSVTERDLTGRLLWEKAPPGLGTWFCVRVPGGNTFTGGRVSWIEIDPKGDIVFPCELADEVKDSPARRPRFDVVVRTPAGRILATCDNVTGTIYELDPRTEEVLQVIKLPEKTKLADYSLEPLPNDNFLLILPDGVREINGKGETVREVKDRHVTHAAGLRSGNILVASYDPVERVIEVTPVGKAVWEMLPDSVPTRVRPCLRLVSFGFGMPPDPLDLSSFDYQLESLKSPEARVRRRALTVLRSLGKDARPGLPAVVEALEDPDGTNQGLAFNVLVNIGAPVSPLVTKLLQSKRPDVRVLSAGVLVDISSRPEDVLPMLMEGLKDKDPYVRERFASMLGGFKSDAKPAVPALVAALQDEARDVRFRAAEALEQLGPAARDAVPALLDALDNGDDEHLRGWAASALGGIKVTEDKIIRALRRRLRDEEGDYARRQAAGALGALGSAAASAVPDLLRLAQSPPGTTKKEAEHMQRTAVAALGRIGAAAAPAIEFLVRLAADQKTPRPLRRAAILALGDIGAPAKKAIPVLTDALGTPTGREPEIQQAIREALGKFSGTPKD